MSLAVQSVLSNIAGGLVILVTKPFQLGDLVETADGLGTVKEISLTFTKLETPDGLWLMTPNSVLSSGKITNYTALGRRRAEIRVGASYDAAVSDVRAACLDAAARVPGVLPIPRRSYTSTATARAASAISYASGAEVRTTRTSTTA